VLNGLQRVGNLKFTWLWILSWVLGPYFCFRKNSRELYAVRLAQKKGDIMKNRKGQFYLIAVILLITIFVGLITVENHAKTEKNIVPDTLDKELSLEKMNVLDYLANIDSNDANSELILTNFSKTYIDKIGKNKNILFIIGKSDSGRIVGNSLNDSKLSYNIGAGSVMINELGEFNIPISPTIANINISVDDYTYTFNLETGQNLYYLIKHEYNNEVHIIHG